LQLLRSASPVAVELQQVRERPFGLSAEGVARLRNVNTGSPEAPKSDCRTRKERFETCPPGSRGSAPLATGMVSDSVAFGIEKVGVLSLESKTDSVGVPIILESLDVQGKPVTSRRCTMNERQIAQVFDNLY